MNLRIAFGGEEDVDVLFGGEETPDIFGGEEPSPPRVHHFHIKNWISRLTSWTNDSAAFELIMWLSRCEFIALLKNNFDRISYNADSHRFLHQP